ncbi:uncharacterized protein LOC117116751 isoform X2 [Anneissia japonica]|uniref:uncharacterized protein LOC117116751 isoform X2 n=1 Tax=Anneissia japonica TaxID=1529436 RepID=UPI0014258974|nr:uncharacterized protein LOC117116751 isoform X2 [Anneissia japonica]
MVTAAKIKERPGLKVSIIRGSKLSAVQIDQVQRKTMLKLAIASRCLSGARTSFAANAFVRCISSSVTSHITNCVTSTCHAQSLPFTNQFQGKLQQTCHAVKLDEIDKLLSRLSLSPAELKATLTLVLPGKQLDIQVPTAIVEPISTPIYKCPQIGIVSDGIDKYPLLPGINRLEKKAKNRITNEIHRRRRKMNHHQYKKWRKKMKFKLRQIKQKRRKRKQKKWERYLEGLKFKGLSQEEGEAYLKAQEEKFKIYLRYLGFEGDAVKIERTVRLRGIQYVRRPKRLSRRMNDGKSGLIIPTPIR